ncbi:MAG: prohibitin family protein [Saprospiraceae bacterium]|nr:prohibitin family protein [Saprospiraceae bacterium]HMW40146.1 prohibitin family protein [Saprospiraceae bacterium]HMX87191.1 prohibitin family protein [Saprospiraceae bacterium]HMZ38729.1 prohibitin family protein [Saprospiraceae bacterium]HNA64705.1 prohibitin family protein [Saprospiraceae bacterium]
MVLVVIGVVMLIALSIMASRNSGFLMTGMTGRLRIAALILIGIGLFSQCIVQIEAGYIGVKSLFGKVQPDVLYPGLHVLNPLLRIYEIESRVQNYTMSGVHDEGQKSGDDAIRALTKDGLEVIIDLTVLYRVNPESAPKLINELGIDYQDKIVRPITRTRIRDNGVYYEAVDLYSHKREEFQNNINKSIDTDFKNRGLVLEQILIRNISLPLNVKSAIEEKIKAEQESQKMQFILQKEKQEADRKRIEAQGIADYQKIINTGLTDKQLEYERIKALKELSLSQNAKVVITQSKNTPFIVNGN